jgi:alginate O-acetyltransferase complex protein AlgI
MAMAFSSIHFLFLFLPIFLILYFVLPYKWYRNGILLISSLVFYAWGEPVYILLLIGSILLNWLLALQIAKSQNQGHHAWAKAWMVIAVSSNLLILFYFKYSIPLILMINSLNVSSLLVNELALPLGVSFFTFSAMSYVVDVYQEELKAQTNLINVANYIAMFPKLVQGPIARFEQVAKDLINPSPALGDVAEGTRRFIIGLSKKVLIADNLALVANGVMGANHASLGGGLAWYGLIAYGLQIYFDFSGYTDMAIGLGRILGFHLPENFNYPYISRNITDFWRRWHMTLIAWFRLYVFYPLEIARKQEKRFRQQTNILIVFLLTGLWHGASWNFALWGLYFGVILIIEAGGLAKWLKKIPVVFQHIYTLGLLLFGWMLFRLVTLSDLGTFMKALMGINGMSGSVTARSLNVLLYWPLIIVAMIGCTPWVKNQWLKLRGNSIGYFVGDFVLVGLFLLCVFFLLSNGYKSFLYFQF